MFMLNQNAIIAKTIKTEIDNILSFENWLMEKEINFYPPFPFKLLVQFELF